MQYQSLSCVSFPNRFDIEIEPLFACIALYDIKERKKVSVYRIFFSVGLGFYLQSNNLGKLTKNLLPFYTCSLNQDLVIQPVPCLQIFIL